MEVYIVYEGEFETDKPRNYMAEPRIILITTDSDGAYVRFEAEKQRFKNEYDAEDMYFGTDYFDYDGYKRYGRVGILRKKMG